jgi:hypothetical protein
VIERKIQFAVNAGLHGSHADRAWLRAGGTVE